MRTVVLMDQDKNRCTACDALRDEANLTGMLWYVCCCACMTQEFSEYSGSPAASAPLGDWCLPYDPPRIPVMATDVTASVTTLPTVTPRDEFEVGDMVAKNIKPRPVDALIPLPADHPSVVNATAALRRAVQRTMTQVALFADKVPAERGAFAMLAGQITKHLACDAGLVVVCDKNRLGEKPLPPGGFRVTWNGVSVQWPEGAPSWTAAVQPPDVVDGHALVSSIDRAAYDMASALCDPDKATGDALRKLLDLTGTPDTTEEQNIERDQFFYGSGFGRNRSEEDPFPGELVYWENPAEPSWAEGQLLTLDRLSEKYATVRILVTSSSEPTLVGAMPLFGVGIHPEDQAAEVTRPSILRRRTGLGEGASSHPLKLASAVYSTEMPKLSTTRVAIVDSECQPNPHHRIRLEPTRPDGFDQHRIDQIKASLLAVGTKGKK